MSATIMNAKDTLSAKLAECYVTVNGNRYNFMQAINMEAVMEKSKVQVPILGKTARGNKATGWSGKGKAKFHYNTSVFRRLLKEYKNSVNEDPTASVGRQSIVLLDCNLDGGVIAKFDADGSYLDEEMEFTFEDFKIVEEFKNIEGML